MITTPFNIPSHSPDGDTCLHEDRSKHRCIPVVPVTIATASAAGQAAPAVAIGVNSYWAQGLKPI